MRKSLIKRHRETIFEIIRNETHIPIDAPARGRTDDGEGRQHHRGWHQPLLHRPCATEPGLEPPPVHLLPRLWAIA